MGKAFQMFSTAMTTASAGKAIRLGRLGATGRSRSLMVPMDHTFSNGPLGAADHTRETVRLLAGSGVDAVVLHRGRVRYVDPAAFEQMALVVHLSGSTDLALDVHAKTLVSGVEEAMRCGADAVSVHVNVGCETEREQLADFGRVSAECERLGMPLLAMMYARGPGPDLPEGRLCLRRRSALQRGARPGHRPQRLRGGRSTAYRLRAGPAGPPGTARSPRGDRPRRRHP